MKYKSIHVFNQTYGNRFVPDDGDISIVGSNIIYHV